MAVLISHRFSTVRMCDRIVVLEGGPRSRARLARATHEPSRPLRQPVSIAGVAIRLRRRGLAVTGPGSISVATPPLPTPTLHTCTRIIRSVCAVHSRPESSHPSSSSSSPLSLLSGEDCDRFIPGAAGWVVDHYHFLEAQIAETLEALPRRAYRALPREDVRAGALPRVHAMARHLVGRFTNSTIPAEWQTVPLLDASMLRAHFTETQRIARCAWPSSGP